MLTSGHHSSACRIARLLRHRLRRCPMRIPRLSCARARRPAVRPGRPAPPAIPLRLCLLEDRCVPALATWTGADVPDGHPNWSDATNWAGQAIPQTGDSVTFPALAAKFKTDSVNNLGSLTLGTVSIQDSGYRITDLASGPGSGGVITPTGVFTATYD